MWRRRRGLPGRRSLSHRPIYMYSALHSPAHSPARPPAHPPMTLQDPAAGHWPGLAYRRRQPRRHLQPAHLSGDAAAHCSGGRGRARRGRRGRCRGPQPQAAAAADDCGCGRGAGGGGWGSAGGGGPAAAAAGAGGGGRGNLSCAAGHGALLLVRLASELSLLTVALAGGPQTRCCCRLIPPLLYTTATCNCQLLNHPEHGPQAQQTCSTAA